jgi:hypothetical protein
MLITLVLVAASLAQTKPPVKAEVKPETAKTEAAAPAAPVKYEATELETLRLQNVQKDIALQNAQMQQMQEQYARVQQQQQVSVQALQKLQDDIRTAHKWEKDIQYNFQTGAWEKAVAAKPTK